MTSLETAQLTSSAVLAPLTTFSNELEPGTQYGFGVWQFRFTELSPFLFPMTDLQGGVGSTGTFVLHDAVNDVDIVANFGSLSFSATAFEELIDIRLLLDRRDVG